MTAPSLPVGARGRFRAPFLAENARYIVLFGLAALWLLPALLMVSTSLKTQAQLAHPTDLLPNPVAWENYPRILFELFPFSRYFLNSTIIAVASVIGDVLSSAFIAYGFARLDFPGRKLLFVLMISTMMFPFAVRMIPMFILFKQLGWVNTFYPLIVPNYFGTNAFFIFLLYNFFRGIPGALIESARIDGANELQVWWRIVLPLSRPALAVVAILSFEQSWNEFLPPLLFLSDTNLYTLPLGLYSLVGSPDVASNWHLVMAAGVTMIAPIVLIFVLAQRFFVGGISMSGLKG